MTVSLTVTDSSSTNPPTPNDMTSTTASPSPPVPQSSNIAGIEASSPSSAIAKEVAEFVGAASESAAVDTCAKSMALDSNHGDEETEEETATEYAGDDDTSHVTNPTTKSDSDCKVQVNNVAKKRSNDACSDRCDDDQHDDADNDESVNEMPSESSNRARMTCESGNKRVSADSKGSTHRNSEPAAGEPFEAVKSHSESEQMSSENVGEMARNRAAKFIQERTKMACILNSSADTEAAKLAPNPTTVVSSQQGSSRKRKLTVKDILVSQRNRDTGSKQQRVHESHLNSNNAALSQMFAGLGPMLDPSLHMNDANPFAAISAALAAATSTNGSATNGTNLPSGLVPDSQSTYISTLASTLSSNANPTATLALMASLSAMMQNSSNKESNEGAASAAASSASNPLVSLESTLANVMASNFGQSSHTNLNNSTHEEEDDDDDRIDGGHVPLDFSLKTTFAPKEEKTSSSRRKPRKKVNGEGGTEDHETPLDLSVTTKRPDESSPNKHDNPLAAIFSQVPSMDGANGSNFAAMAAAAAAAAAAASFSPNLLTKMAASMAPWSGYGGMQGLGKLGNDPSAAAAAFNVLFQQMNNNANNSPSNKSGNSMTNTPSPANLFQAQFPDLYWNGKLAGKTSTPSPSFGGLSNSSLSARHHHHQPPPAASQPMRTKSSSGRQNPWQAQWINRSSEQTRDVFTCVWCKESFKSLAEMTDHMKRSPRCGMAGMQQHHSHQHSHAQPSAHHATTPTGMGPAPQSTGKMSALGSPPNPLSMNAMKESSGGSNLMGGSNNSSGNSVAGSNSKSSGGVNMPRKLVRGQDVWLGRGAEQTRQILKCMWCGQSFKSLADMTQHMKITQHYTNIISQEQITSWRTPDEKMAQSQVNAVLTCKVCDEAFGSLKELSNHMIKNSHFKENSSVRDSSGRSTPTSLPVPVSSSSSASRGGRPASGAPSSDRRKKSLPVRKLLELERGEFKRGVDDDEAEESQKSPKSTASQLIECDDCHEKIEPRCFLQHIKQCRAKNVKSDAESEKSKAESEKGDDEKAQYSSDDEPNHKNESKNEESKESESEKKNDAKNDDHKTGGGEETGGSGSSGSVLSALEKLIEKNFDSKSRRSQQTGILQRLGIDEEVFPPWQNMAPSPLSAMSPTMGAWNSMNGMEFSRSNSSSSSNSRVNSATPAIPQLRYRRNSSSASLKDKFLTGLSASIKATESNGSFSSQETEEEESCDESNSDCGSAAPNHRSQKRPLYSLRAQDKSGRLNFPISSMLSSPVPARPTSASSTASSISPSEPITPSQSAVEQLHRMTPNSHRSAQDEEDDENELASPLALCKRSGEGNRKRSKMNGASEDGDDNDGAGGGSGDSERPSHNPLLQLQKLLDKTDTSARHSAGNKSGSGGGTNSSNQRMSPFAGWHDSPSLKTSSPASSPRTPPIHSPSSVKSDEASYLTLKCAFCDTQIASRAAYRAHLAKIHLAMRDSVDLSAVSDEELLLLVLAKNSNLPLVPGGNSGLLATASAKVSPRPKESSSKRKSKADLASWNKSPNHPTNSPSASPQLETSQSKFLKYAELAKQLSSKYV